MSDQENLNQEDRMARLSQRADGRSYSERYTHFVRVMRFALPLAALVMVGFVFLGAYMQDSLVSDDGAAYDDPKLDGKDATRNELINPVFESTDKRSQPYKVIAERAVQGEKNKDLIMLEQPSGTMTMQNGTIAKMRAVVGAYRQDTERFYLQGDVHFEQSEGYSFESDELHVDMQKNFTWSEVDVKGYGPGLKIYGKGMRADGKTNEVVLVGPAKVVFDQGAGGRAE